jgi:hypothetical protein
MFRKGGADPEPLKRAIPVVLRVQPGMSLARPSDRGEDMKLRSILMAAALASATLSVFGAAAYGDGQDEANERDVSLDQVPAAARQTITREAAGAPILKVEQEVAHGKTLYEAHIKRGDDVIGLRVDSSGTVIDRHSEKNEKPNE